MLDDEEDLARRAAAGDQAAFALLAERRRRYIYAVAYRVLMNEEDALDATQEALIKLSRKIGQYRGEGGFGAWLATLTTREALNIARRPARRERAAPPEAMAELSDAREAARIAGGGDAAGQDDPRERLDRETRRGQVERAMGGLPPQQRAILGLRLNEELTSAEIAERLELSPPQVRSQLSRAIARLRELLAEPNRTKIKT